MEYDEHTDKLADEEEPRQGKHREGLAAPVVGHALEVEVGGYQLRQHVPENKPYKAGHQRHQGSDGNFHPILPPHTPYPPLSAPRAKALPPPAPRCSARSR